MSNLINVCIDPGHGGKGVPGAVSRQYGYQEKEIALDISLKVRDFLLYATKENDTYILNEYCPQGHKALLDVLMTRIDDTDISLKDRCKKANSAKSKFFISIHCNSCTSVDPNGVETWCYETSKGSKALATNIQKAIMDHVKGYSLEINGKSQLIKSRGVKATTVYYTLRHTSMPSVVVECGFMSNPQEVRLMYENEQYRVALAKGIAIGILKSL